MSNGTERKEKVLHTRIPAALEEQIKRMADSLRVPVSNLVRNMLEDAIEVTRRVRNRVPYAPAPTEAPERDDLSDVFGWQGLTLNRQAPCARCQLLLPAGAEAYLGLTDIPRPERVFLCGSCLPGPGKVPKKKTTRKRTSSNGKSSSNTKE